MSPPVYYPRAKVGERFGRLTVIGLKTGTHGATTPIVQCDCGSDAYLANHTSLQIGRRLRCRYCQKESMTPKIILGNTWYVWRNRWHAMHTRCNDPKSKSYKMYGGRGIRVCRRWYDFTKFAEDITTLDGWNLIQELGLEMDRINNDGPYQLDNVRLVSKKDNIAKRNRND